MSAEKWRIKLRITITGGRKEGDTIIMDGEALLQPGSSKWKKGVMADRYFKALQGDEVSFPMEGKSKKGFLKRIEPNE